MIGLIPLLPPVSFVVSTGKTLPFYLFLICHMFVFGVDKIDTVVPCINVLKIFCEFCCVSWGEVISAELGRYLNAS
jgi:hypothetical protein